MGKQLSVQSMIHDGSLKWENNVKTLTRAFHQRQQRHA